jgi:hypothetical protein
MLILPFLPRFHDPLETVPRCICLAESAPAPAKADVGQARREEIAALCRRAGLVLNERQFEQLCATASYVDSMVGRLWKARPFDDEPMNIFRVPDHSPR